MPKAEDYKHLSDKELEAAANALAKRVRHAPELDRKEASDLADELEGAIDEAVGALTYAKMTPEERAAWIGGPIEEYLD